MSTRLVSVCLTEFNEKVFVASMKAEGALAMAIRLVKKGRLSVEEAVEELQMSEDEFLKCLEAEESVFAE